MPNIINYPLRLLPGEDLKQSIQQFVTKHSITAGWIVTGIGSLTEFNIRFANQPSGSQASGKFEILSLAGTLSQDGLHLHISVADGNGNVLGGHLLDGCIIYTTAEIIIQADSRFMFKRKVDGSTPWHELSISGT